MARALDPLRSFHLQLDDEIRRYERLHRGELDELVNLHGLGRTLIALRIALGLTQRELADRLGIHESEVSRDERNEYRGIAVERATRVLDALNVQLRSHFVEPVLPPSAAAEQRWRQFPIPTRRLSRRFPVPSRHRIHMGSDGMS